MAPTVPLRDPLVELKKDPKGRLIGEVSWSWLNYFLKQNTRITESPHRLRRVSLTVQAAAIATTPVPLAALGAGLYRITIYARITQPATVSSSLTVTVGWTDGGVSVVASGAAIIGNTTATQQSFSQLVKLDQATPLTYATAYASVGGTPMQYALEVVIEELATT
jgi:hypothetical protein